MNILNFISKYPSHIKYGLIVVFIFFMIIAVKNYLNYDNILYKIDEVKGETYKVQQQINYTENFLLPYLSSEYSNYFLAHENSILYKGEEVIKFEFVEKKVDSLDELEDEIIKSQKQTKSGEELSPKESRDKFLKKIFEDIK